MPIYIRTRPEVAVNSFTTDNQTAPSVATFADGGFVVVWGSLDPAQDGSGSAIKGQLFDSAGRKVGFEFQVNSAASGHQFTPSVATLENGNFVVTWATTGAEPFPAGSGSDGISARMFDRSGGPVGGEFKVDTSGSTSLFEPEITALENGGFVISWADWDGFEVKARLYDANGFPAGAEFTINANTNGTQDSADITALASGGFVATWRTTDAAADGSGEAVKAQIFAANGARVGGEFLVNSHKPDGQYDPSITALAGGGFVITWATRDPAQDGSSGAVKGQIFDASGARVGGEFLVNTEAADIQREAVVTGTPDGGFVVAWTNYSSSQDGSSLAIKAQAFDAAGAKVGAEMLVNTLTSGAQFLPDIATLADGRVIVTWASTTGDISGYSVRAQILGTQPADPLPNTAPTIIWPYGTTGSVIMDEGATAVTRVVASDDGEPTALRYSITGGTHADLFTIDALTGDLAFIEAPEHVEGGNNSYQVIVSASDGELSGWQQIYVSILHVNHVTIVSDGGSDWAEVSIDENQTGVTTVSAVDEDGLALTYSITGGEDAFFFTIDPQTGELSFAIPPDYEFPEDRYGDNVYFVQVTATDGTRSDSQDITVYVADVEETGGVVITSDGGGNHASVAVDENAGSVTVVAATASGPLTYQIVGGADAGAFVLDPSTGALSFLYPPNYEWAEDYDHDNVFEVIVRASDGDSFDEQHLSVAVANVDELPDFYEGWGDSTIHMWAYENGSRAAELYAYDPDGGSPISYAITGGADAAFFAIDYYTGALTFVSGQGQDFETPADADGDNDYEVQVTASSSAWSQTRNFAIDVVDLNEPVRIVSNGGGASGAVTTSENGAHVTTVVGLDPEGRLLNYSITGGADGFRFTINPVTGVLSFVAAPSYEAPGDSDRDNVYEVQVQASDGQHMASQTLRVTVANVNEGVTISSTPALTVLENGTAVATITASDADGDQLRYAIAGGADAALFAIDAQTGALSFVGAPNFEAPGDSGGDNVHDVTVSATDGILTATKAFTVTVGNVNEALAITSNGGGGSAPLAVAENGTAVSVVAASDPDGDAVTYAIVGGADASRFTIDAVTGVLAFVAQPDFESPGDVGADNVYDVIVSASDGTFTDTQALAVSVDNVDEALAITSDGGGATASVWVGENGRTVTKVVAADPDGTSPVYAIVGGADATRFTIDPQTGVLLFIATPDYELPGDADGDNVYDVVVQASDGQHSDVQALSVGVANLRDGATVNGTSGSDSISGTSTNPALRTTNAEDTVFGRDGHDTIQGLGGDDWLYGDGGNDTLTGGGGADRLTGGPGKDQFVYNLVSDSTPGARDVVTDFSRSQGDRISLSAIDANSLVGGNQAFTFIGAAAFSGVAGQLRFEQAGGNTFVSGDVNGDRVADFQIELTGPITPVASDFVL